jgi:hypothetical protein
VQRILRGCRGQAWQYDYDLPQMPHPSERGALPNGVARRALARVKARPGARCKESNASCKARPHAVNPMTYRRSQRPWFGTTGKDPQWERRGTAGPLCRYARRLSRRSEPWPGATIAETTTTRRSA